LPGRARGVLPLLRFGPGRVFAFLLLGPFGVGFPLALTFGGLALLGSGAFGVFFFLFGDPLGLRLLGLLGPLGLCLLLALALAAGGLGLLLGFALAVAVGVGLLALFASLLGLGAFLLFFLFFRRLPFGPLGLELPLGLFRLRLLGTLTFDLGRALAVGVRLLPAALAFGLATLLLGGALLLLSLRLLLGPFGFFALLALALRVGLLLLLLPFAIPLGLGLLALLLLGLLLRPFGGHFGLPMLRLLGLGALPLAFGLLLLLLLLALAVGRLLLTAALGLGLLVTLALAGRRVVVATWGGMGHGDQKAGSGDEGQDVSHETLPYARQRPRRSVGAELFFVPPANRVGVSMA
jgi:hypothetical protein